MIGSKSEDGGIYRILYEHAGLCFEAEEKRESRLQVRSNLLLTVIVAALGLGFFGFAPKVFPDLVANLASHSQALLVEVLLLIGAGWLLLSLSYLFGIFSPEEFQLTPRGRGSGTGPDLLTPTLELQLDPDVLESLPDTDDDLDHYYAVVFADTQAAAATFHEGNNSRQEGIEVAQSAMVMGVVFLLAGFVCYALMQG